MVGFVHAFLRLVWETAPDLLADFDAVRHASSLRAEAAAAEAVYSRLGPVNFSERMLGPCPRRLATVPVNDLQWSDWGQPARVLASLRGAGAPRPSWLSRVDLGLAV